MKIFACCNWGLKFTGLVTSAWVTAGHEVNFKPGYDADLHEWADVCFVDVCDHNAQVASKNRFPGSRLVIRAIDIECWAGQHRGVTWENVDGLAFGAHHIGEMVLREAQIPDGVQIAHVPFGIDPSQWTYRDREHGPNVACIAHRWSAKGLPLLYQVMFLLGPDFKLHLLGTPSTERWLHAYLSHLAETLGIEVHIAERVDDVDAWLEDKHYHILASQKETFSYATAEAAAKGIKPLVHNFYGAADVWPDEWLWDTPIEAVDKLGDGYDSAGYRHYVEDHYSVGHMMRGLNELCELGSS